MPNVEIPDVLIIEIDVPASAYCTHLSHAAKGVECLNELQKRCAQHVPSENVSGNFLKINQNNMQ